MKQRWWQGLGVCGGGGLHANTLHAPPPPPPHPPPPLRTRTRCTPAHPVTQPFFFPTRLDMSAGRSSGMEADGLPPGWEEHKDEYGRSYYYHSNTDESTWTRPIQVAVDTGDQSYYVVIKSESERQQFFAGVYRELRAAMPFLPRARKHPTKKGKMVPVKVPTMVELYKAARHENVAPQAFASFISKSLNEKVGKHKGKTPVRASSSSSSSSSSFSLPSSLSSPSVLRSSNSTLGSPRRAGKGSAGRSLRRSRRGGGAGGGHADGSGTSTRSSSKSRSSAKASAKSKIKSKAKTRTKDTDATPGFSPNPLAFSSPRKSHKRTFNQRSGATDGKESGTRAAKRIALSSSGSGARGGTPLLQQLPSSNARSTATALGVFSCA